MDAINGRSSMLNDEKQYFLLDFQGQHRPSRFDDERNFFGTDKSVTLSVSVAFLHFPKPVSQQKVTSLA